MLKNNKSLWVAATITGCFAVLVSIVNSIFLYFQNKRQHKLDKQFEKYKARIDKKTYMSRTKFDAEFSMYRELSQIFAQLVKEIYQLFPTFTKDSRTDYDTYKERYDKCVDVIVLAQDKLNSCAPFISNTIYDDYKNIEDLCKIQLSDFQDFRLRPDAEEFRKDCKDEYHKTYKRTREIQEAYETGSNNLRAYINSIDVIYLDETEDKENG